MVDGLRNSIFILELIITISTNQFEDYGYSYSPANWLINGWPDQAFTDANNNTMIRSESQYDVSLIGVNFPIGDTLGWLGLDSGYNSPYSAMAVGYPAGATGMMREIVYIEKNRFFHVYESDVACMGPGSSGGPLLVGDNVIGVKSTGIWWADIGLTFNQLSILIEENNTLLSASNIIGPTVISFSPTEGATGVAVASNIVVTFSEAIVRGTGNIVLKTAEGTTIETFDAATSRQLSITGSTLTIDPTTPLTNGMKYYVSLEQGIVNGVTGNGYTGTATCEFTTIQQVLKGTSGNDLLTGGLGDDIFNGADGVDTIILSGLPSQYHLNGSTLSGIEGTDTVISIEQYRFGNIYLVDINPSALIDPDGTGPADTPATELLKGISDLYVAYFNRAPDVDGLMYWFRDVMNGSSTVSAIAQSFTDQPEYKATYPDDLSNREFIKTIYQNLFDRDPDKAGWDYWENDLNHGLPRNMFIYSVIQGAYAPTGGATDKALLNNKHDVSLYYSEQLATHPSVEFDTNIDKVLNRVTANAKTVGKAEAVIDYVIDNPITLTGVVNDTATWEAFWV
jgi:methionine-rich copper-binding protein CopC